jgi:DNA-binding transcriptional ArsR family regulator
LPLLLCSHRVLRHRVPPVVAVNVIAEYIVSAMANDTFKALSHPIRRDIVERLSGGASTVGDATRDLGVSKPTISRHLKVLEEAGVVTRVIDGRTHRLALQPDALADTAEWIEKQRTRWERLFDGAATTVTRAGSRARPSETAPASPPGG